MSVSGLTKQLQNRLVMQRINELRGDFSQRDQHEFAVNQAGMRNSQIFIPDDLLPEIGDVQVNGPRTIRKVPLPTKFLFDCLAICQQFVWAGYSLELDGKIIEPGLVDVGNRFRQVQR